MLGYVLGLLLGVTAFADTPCPDGQTRDAKVCDAQSLPRDTKTQCCAVPNKGSEAYDPHMEAGLRHMFTLFDTDKDEEVSSDEVFVGMERLGEKPVREAVALLMKATDLDGNGTLSFAEFYAQFAPNVASRADEEHQRGLFKQYDADGSGSISPSELSAVMKQIGSPMSDVEIQRMVKEADQDGDGLVNFPEFLKMMT
jgi:calmodulin